VLDLKLSAPERLLYPSPFRIPDGGSTELHITPSGGRRSDAGDSQVIPSRGKPHPFADRNEPSVPVIDLPSSKDSGVP
jgi:hypothetical protein